MVDRRLRELGNCLTAGGDVGDLNLVRPEGNRYPLVQTVRHSESAA